MWVRLRLQLPSRLQVTLPGSARGCPTVRERFRTGQSALGTRCSDEATSIGYTWVRARVAELADALDLGSSVFDVWVRVPSRAPVTPFAVGYTPSIHWLS